MELLQTTGLPAVGGEFHQLVQGGQSRRKDNIKHKTDLLWKLDAAMYHKIPGPSKRPDGGKPGSCTTSTERSWPMTS